MHQTTSHLIATAARQTLTNLVTSVFPPTDTTLRAVPVGVLASTPMATTSWPALMRPALSGLGTLLPTGPPSAGGSTVAFSQGMPSPCVWGCTSGSAKARPYAFLCAEVLRDHILRDFQHLGMTLFFKNYKHTLDVSVQARRSDPATHYPIHPPTVHVVGRILGVETHGMSKQVVLMRDQWENFLHKVIGGLFFKFVILLQSDEDNKADELKDYQAVMWESSNQQPLFGNDVAYIQGLIDCFLSTAKQRTYQRGQGRIVVRRVEGSDVLQTFMFGRKVDRQALLSTSTLRGPLHTITVLQTKGLGVHGGGARKGGQNGSSRLSRCERVHFVDAVRKGVPVKCVLE